MKKEIDETFREEARELLGELEAALLDLEERPRDPIVVERIFRVLHTLKGSGSMAGFDALADLAHDVETAYDLVRSGALQVSRELISLTLSARDSIAAMVEVGDDDDEERRRAAGVTGAFRSFLPQGAAGEAIAAEAGKMCETAEIRFMYRIHFRPAADTFLRGNNPASLIRELGRLGECRVVARVDAIPGLAEINPELCYLGWNVSLLTELDENAIRDVFIFVEGESELEIESIDLGDVPELDSEVQQGQEMRGDRGGRIPMTPRSDQDGRNPSRQYRREDAEKLSSVRVRSEKLDCLVDLIGELVTIQARLRQTVGKREDAELTSIAEEVERLAWLLRDQVLSIRMLPIGDTFGKLRRLVRDLGQELGKDVELTIEGADTELDKTVIEGLDESLLHLIRNCVDHGIEGPVDRQAAGKPPCGRIHLEARHSGPNVMLRVADDGRGLDLEGIRAKAAEIGLSSAQAEIATRDAHAMIFHPGFTTARNVTSVSGRGVGLDIVKQRVERMRGSVEIVSHPGEGTTFTLKLPLTLAIIDGLLVRLGKDHFVLPLSAVEECVELKAEDEARAHGRNLVRVRGEIVPFVNLRERFRTGGSAPPIRQIVIANVEERRVGLVVDQVIGGHQTVIKSLGGFCRDVPGLAGATILGDGTVALILDVPRLIDDIELTEEKNG